MEAEREALLTSTGEALDTACRGLANNAEDKLQVFRLANSVACLHTVQIHVSPSSIRLAVYLLRTFWTAAPRPTKRGADTHLARKGLLTTAA